MRGNATQLNILEPNEAKKVLGGFLDIDGINDHQIKN